MNFKKIAILLSLVLALALSTLSVGCMAIAKGHDHRGYDYYFDLED